MLAVFKHGLAHRYGGYSGLGSFAHNLLHGFDQIGYRYISVPEDLPRSPLSRLTQSRFLNEQWDLLRLRDVDSVLFPNYFLPPLKNLKVKSTVVVHDTLFADIPGSAGRIKSAWLKFAFGTLLRQATNVVFISKFARDKYFLNFGQARGVAYHVVPNPINEDVFTFQPEKSRARIPRVITVSSFSPHKNYETFVRLATRYKGRAEFISIGSLPRPEHWKNVVRNAPDLEGKIGNVEFTGYVTQARMIDLMASSDVFLHPSRYEGFGMPPVEAVAMGLPAIVSDIPPLRETLEGKAAFVADPNDIAEWSRQLDRILAAPPSPDLRAQWSSQVRTRYSRAAIAREYQNVIAPGSNGVD